MCSGVSCSRRPVSGQTAPHQKVRGVTSSGRAGEKGGGASSGLDSGVSPHQTWTDGADMIDVNTVEVCVCVCVLAHMISMQRVWEKGGGLDWKSTQTQNFIAAQQVSGMFGVLNVKMTSRHPAAENPQERVHRKQADEGRIKTNHLFNTLEDRLQMYSRVLENRLSEWFPAHHHVSELIQQLSVTNALQLWCILLRGSHRQMSYWSTSWQWQYLCFPQRKKTFAATNNRLEPKTLERESFCIHEAQP